MRAFPPLPEHTLLLEENQRLREALADLAQAEANYRSVHDRNGDGHRSTGRAWDLMRRAGDKARTLIPNVDEHLRSLTNGVDQPADESLDKSRDP